MGKAEIINHIGDGLYQIKVLYNTSNKAKRLAALEVNIQSLEEQLSEAEPGSYKYNVIQLQITALNKQKTALNSIPDETSIQAWCGDKTENLGGFVGTIEVPGESTNVNIQPGHENNSVYNSIRDGQLMQTLAQGPEQAFFNWAVFPGWQKWKPTFRYGVITSLSGDTCSIELEDIKSSQQSLNINQTPTLENVPIEYMTCNGTAFSEGDSVIVMFGNQSWSEPKVIGFKEEPQPCAGALLKVTLNGYVIVWDLEENKMVDTAKDNVGNPISFPCPITSVSNWLASFTEFRFYSYLTSRSSANYLIYAPDDDGDYWLEMYCKAHDFIDTEAPYYINFYDENGKQWHKPFLEANGQAIWVYDGGSHSYDLDSVFTVQAGTIGTLVCNHNNDRRSFNPKMEMTENKVLGWCNGSIAGSGFCTGVECDQVNPTILMTTKLAREKKYTISSPFSDGLQYEVIANESSSQRIEWKDVSTAEDPTLCEQFYEKESCVVLGWAQGIHGDINLPFMFSYYAIEVEKTVEVYDSCSMGIDRWADPLLDLVGCESEGEFGSGVEWLKDCTATPSTTSSKVLSPQIKCFLGSVPEGSDPSTLDPYELPQHEALSLALDSLLQASGSTNLFFDSTFLK